MTGAPKAEGGLTAAEVTAFLRRNPGFLADHPALYATLAPPARVHGEALADHMAAMLRAARAEARAMGAQADGVVAASRAAAGMAARVQEAVLALIGAADTGECITAELPGLLGLDAATFCVEAPATPINPPTGAKLLAAGSVARLLGSKDVVFRIAPRDAGMLHGEAVRLAAQDALVRVPLPGPPALLALAAREAVALHAGQGTAALAFLGRAVSAAMVR